MSFQKDWNSFLRKFGISILCLFNKHFFTILAVFFSRNNKSKSDEIQKLGKDDGNVNKMRNIIILTQQMYKIKLRNIQSSYKYINIS